MPVPVSTPGIERIVERKEIPAPSKEQLIKEWFEAHPEDLKKTGRELELIQLPFGVTATYKTWNNVKKNLGK